MTISTIVLISLIVGWGISVVLAWEPPTASPPDGNVAAPINVSGTAQTKSGDLNIGGSVDVTGSLTANTLSGTLNAQNISSGTFGSGAGYGNYSFTTSGGSPVLYIDAINARVGIGKVPGEKLDVDGTIKGTELCIGTVCNTSWPSGTDNQQLSIVGHTISLTNSPSVTVPDNYEPDTSAVTICSGTDVLTGTGTCVANYDGYAANTDTQDLSIIGHTISLVNGGSVIVPDNYEPDTNANTICAGTNVYLDGDGNCDTEYWVNTTGDTMSGSLTVQDNVYVNNPDFGQGLVGRYDSYKYRLVYSMGSAYMLSADGTGAGNLYGLAYTYPRAALPQAISGLGHQLVLMANGVTTAAMGTGIWTSGNLTVGGNATVGGQNVCRQDGTNCPSASGGDADTLDGIDSLGFARWYGRVVTDFNNYANSPSGFYGVSGTGANGPEGSYQAMINARNIDVGFQLVGGYTTDDLWYRGWSGYGATFYPWRRIWHDGNDGSGSGLDADLLDNLHASSFCQSNGTNCPASSAQQLSIVDHTISLTDGGSVTVPDNYAPNTTCNGISCNISNTGTLDGYNATTASTVSTIAVRNGSGDINARLFRSEYDSTNATINYIMTQIDTVSNNYIRPSTPTQLATALTSPLETYFLRSNTSDTMSGSLTVTGDLTVGGRTFTNFGSLRTFENVAYYYNGNTISTGTIVITIGNTPNIMLDAEITIQGYGGLTECRIRGYTYTGSTTWHLPAGTCISSGHSGGYTVRFGKRASDNARVILIGTTSSGWGAYPHVLVKRVTIGYPGSGTALGDWSISIVTNESAYTSIAGIVENSTFQVGKLTVGTIDPIYEIDGIEYATYVSDFAGGVRMETSGVIQLNSEAKYVIDFDNLEKETDLWLFWETSNKEMDDLAVVISAGFEGKVWYNKDGNKLIIYGDESGEVSYRLTLPRLDDEEWGNLVVDKE